MDLGAAWVWAIFGHTEKLGKNYTARKAIKERLTLGLFIFLGNFQWT